jgi:hypothetical protein
MSKRRPKKRVGDLLRTLAEVMRKEYDSKDYPMDERVAFEWYCRMRVVADYIDAEHERRMESQRQNYRRLIDG